jgi:hypothetical protein
MPFPKVTDDQPTVGNVRAVQVIPSGEVAAEAPPDTATKTPFPYVTDFQLWLDGNVRAVQVVPFGEVAAAVVLLAMARKTPFP